MSQQPYMTRGNIAFAIIVVLLIFLIAIQLLQTLQTTSSSVEPERSFGNDLVGPTIITGTVRYSDPLFIERINAPIIVLEDQAGFVDRNPSFMLSLKSQTLGQITSDFRVSPFAYSLSLPIEPQGSLRDVDNDGEEDIGVMVFAIAYWNNTFGDAFLEQRDLIGGGWSQAYASTKVSQQPESQGEVQGGNFVIYAPVPDQSFPTDFGADQRLFTDDDPIAAVAQGYTVVDMDTRPFTFDRVLYPTVDLIEPEQLVRDDFSALSYSQAFDAMIAKLRREYAFTEYKQIDWTQKSDEFRPQFVKAEEETDREAYINALGNLLRSIPDGHVSSNYLAKRLETNTKGSLGLELSELNDGRIIVSALRSDGPAGNAGIRSGAEILAFNRRSTEDVLNGIVPGLGSASTESQTRIQKLRELVRFPSNTLVNLTYKNSGGAITNATLITVDEQVHPASSFSTAVLNDFELPLTFYLLPDGYGYVQIHNFGDDAQLTLLLWERLLTRLRQHQIPGLILDIRQNKGRDPYLADQMSAYFFDEPLELGNTAYYDASTADFKLDQAKQHHLPPHSQRYYGDLVAIIGPDCQNACEFFAHNLTFNQRAQFVGHYPTAGMGGTVDLLPMPEEQLVHYTSGRAVDKESRIHIEGQGVYPTVLVPMTERAALVEYDILLHTASQYLKGEIALGAVDESLIVPDEIDNLLLDEPSETLPQIQNLVPLITPVELTLSLATVDTSGGVLNVRSEPNIEGKILGTLPDGATYLVLDTAADEEWLLLSAPGILDDEADSGWVNAEFTRYRGQ